LGEGAGITKKLAKGLESGLQHGAGGMGFAGDKVSDALSTFTGKATETGHRLADFFKSAVRRNPGGRAAAKLVPESGKPGRSWYADEADAESAQQVYSEDDTEAEEPTRSSKISQEEKQALQKALAADRSAKRAAREAARAVNRASRVSRHTHSMKKSAFVQSGIQTVPTAGQVGSKHLSYSEAKRAALKAARKQRVHSL
jgi:hypothetical protein